MAVNIWTPVKQAPHPSTVSGLSILGEKILQAIRYEENTGVNNLEINNISMSPRKECVSNFNSDNNFSQILGIVPKWPNFDGHGQLDIYHLQNTDVAHNLSQQNCPPFDNLTTVDDLFSSSFVRCSEKSTDLTGIVEEVDPFPSPDMEFNDGVLYSTPLGGIIKKTELSNRINQTNIVENSQSYGNVNTHDSFSLGLDDLFVNKSQREADVRDQCFKMVDNKRKPNWIAKKESWMNKQFVGNTKITSYFPISKRQKEIEANQFNKCKAMDSKSDNRLTPNLLKKSIVGKSRATLENDLDSFYNKRKSDTSMERTCGPINEQKFKSNTKPSTFQKDEIGENLSSLKTPGAIVTDDDCSQVVSLSELFSADDEAKKINTNVPVAEGILESRPTFSPKLHLSSVALEKTQTKNANERRCVSPSRSVDLFASQMSFASVDLESQRNLDVYRVENVTQKKDVCMNDKIGVKVVKSDVEKESDNVKSVGRENETNFNARINSKLLNFAYNGSKQNTNKVNKIGVTNLPIRKPCKESKLKDNVVKPNKIVEMKENIINHKQEHVSDEIKSASPKKTESEKGDKVKSEKKSNLKSIMKNNENKTLQYTPAKKVRYNTSVNVMKEHNDKGLLHSNDRSKQKGIFQFFPNKKRSDLKNKSKVRRDEIKPTEEIKVNNNSGKIKTISAVENNSKENAVEKVKRNVVIPDMFKIKALKSENVNNGGVNKVSEGQRMRKKPTFVPPLKKTVSKEPLPTKAYNWITLDHQNITTMGEKLVSTELLQIVFTVVYREGYTLLNKPTTCTKVSRCHPDELMILARWQDCLEYWCCSVNRVYWSDTGLHLVGSFLQLLFSNRCKGKKVCYEAQAVCMLVMDLFGSGQGYDSWSLQDPMVGCWLLDPDNPPQDFSKALGSLNMDQSLMEMPSGCDGKSQACKLLPVLELMMDQVEQKLVKLSLWSLFLDIEMKLLPILAAMECRSICIDKKKLQETASALEMRLQALQEAIYNAAGRRFHINSHVQLRQILYDELKLDTKNNITVKQTAQQGSKSTSEPMLRLLEKVHPLPKIILEYRHLQKVKSTYVDGILQHLNKDNTISTTWEQIGAATGRITSSNPNLQAVPKQPIRINHEGDSPPYYISPRAVFISRPGFTFLAADFQHIEFRVFAHYTQDEYLLGAFKQSQDIFQTLAQQWLGQSGSTERDKTKRIVYSVMYGAGAAKVAEYLQVDVEEANRIISSFLNKFPCLKSLSNKVVEQCRRQGYLHTVAGRLRLFPNITCTNPGLRSYCERQANNFLIQGSAADICKAAMLNCEACLSDPKLNAKLLLQIHDELVWEVADDQLTIVGEKVRSAMEVSSQWGELRVPLTVAISVGKNWADMKPFSNVVC